MADILKSTPYQNVYEVEKDLGNGTYAPLVASNTFVGSSPISATNGLPIVDGYQAPVTTTWTSATAQNTALAVSTAGMDGVLVSFVVTGTITGGVATFEAYDGAAWLPCRCYPLDTPQSYLALTLATGINTGFQIDLAGCTQFRVRLSTAITGSGSVVVTHNVTSVPMVPSVVAQLDPNSSNPITGNIASAATDSGNPVKVGGRYNATIPTYTDGQRTDFQVDSRGSLRVSIATSNGTTAAGVVLPSTGLAAQNSLATYSQGARFNGTNWDQERKANATSRIVSAAASTNATSAKASAGDVISITATNTTASLKYLKIYNKASAPTVGTDTPVLTIPLQPSNVPTMINIPGGLYCSTGIAYALTGAAADADTTALTAGDVVGVNILYA